jgi:hypothetical protein
MSPLKILKGWCTRVGEWWAGHETALAPGAPPQLTPAWVLVGYDPVTGRTWELRDIAALGPVQRADLLNHLYRALAPLVIDLNRERLSPAQIQAAWDKANPTIPEN